MPRVMDKPSYHFLFQSLGKVIVINKVILDAVLQQVEHKRFIQIGMLFGEDIIAVCLGFLFCKKCVGIFSVATFLLSIVMG
jgi:hypothetical protein